MQKQKIQAEYRHDPANLATIYLAIGDRKQPISEWKAANRDTVDGRLVIFARFERVPSGVVSIWVSDTDGERVLTTTKF